jgi:hypothetical protein
MLKYLTIDLLAKPDDAEVRPPPNFGRKSAVMAIPQIIRERRPPWLRKPRSENSEATKSIETAFP